MPRASRPKRRRPPHELPKGRHAASVAKVSRPIAGARSSHSFRRYVSLISNRLSIGAPLIPILPQSLLANGVTLGSTFTDHLFEDRGDHPGNEGLIYLRGLSIKIDITGGFSQRTDHWLDGEFFTPIVRLLVYRVKAETPDLSTGNYPLHCEQDLVEILDTPDTSSFRTDNFSTKYEILMDEKKSFTFSTHDRNEVHLRPMSFERHFFYERKVGSSPSVRLQTSGALTWSAYGRIHAFLVVGHQHSSNRTPPTLRIQSAYKVLYDK